MIRLRRLVVAGIPALAAAAALFAWPFWTLGIPGDPNAPYARGWFLGYLAIGIYPWVYLGWLAVFGIVRLTRWRIAAFLHGVIWLCLAAFAAAMAVSIAWLAGAA